MFVKGGPHPRGKCGAHSAADLGDGPERGGDALHGGGDGLLGRLDASRDGVACLGDSAARGVGHFRHTLGNGGGGRKSGQRVQDWLHVL